MPPQKMSTAASRAEPAPTKGTIKPAKTQPITAVAHANALRPSGTGLAKVRDIASTFSGCAAYRAIRSSLLYQPGPRTRQRTLQTPYSSGHISPTAQVICVFVFDQQYTFHPLLLCYLPMKFVEILHLTAVSIHHHVHDGKKVTVFRVDDAEIELQGDTVTLVEQVVPLGGESDMGTGCVTSYHCKTC